jgi:hypothetical protein
MAGSDGAPPRPVYETRAAATSHDGRQIPPPLARLGRLVTVQETALDGGPMAQVGVGETTEVCEECGAVVGDRDRHRRWHERLATVLPSADQ